jgi:putative DNA methylase
MAHKNDVLDAIRQTAKAGPTAPYVFQGFDPNAAGGNDNFFAIADDVPQLEAAIREWELRKDEDLKGFWPTSEVPYGFMTGIANGDIRSGHGFTHWWKMFNPRQLLVHALLLKAIVTNPRATPQTKFAVLGVFQQYLRNNNQFCFWNIHRPRRLCGVLSEAIGSYRMVQGTLGYRCL